MKLSTQAVMSIMMAVNKGMVAAMQERPDEECDIGGILAGFEVEDSVDGLIVLNPPVLEVPRMDTPTDTTAVLVPGDVDA